MRLQTPLNFWIEWSEPNCVKLKDQKHRFDRKLHHLSETFKIQFIKPILIQDSEISWILIGWNLNLFPFDVGSVIQNILNHILKMVWFRCGIDVVVMNLFYKPRIT